jgi:hypothetical protein
VIAVFFVLMLATGATAGLGVIIGTGFGVTSP